MPRDLYHRVAGGGSYLVFHAPLVSGLTNRLPQSLTINGQAVAPDFLYRGQDATLTDWTAVVGDNLAIAGSGADPTPNQPAPFTDDTQGVLFNGGKYYGASTSIGQVGTEDFVVEVIVRHSGTPGVRIVGTRDASTNGWELFTYSTPTELGFLIGGTTGISTTWFSDSLTAGAYYHHILFFDRSGSVACYTNGALNGGAISIAARAGSLASTQNLLVGSLRGSNLFDSAIVHLALWKRDNWLDTHLQADLAKERFHRLMGIYPQLAKGSAAATFTRNSTAMLKILEYGQGYRFYTVGANWPRVESVRDGRTDRDDPATRSNSFAYSDDLTAGDWSTIRSSIATGTGETLPDGTELQGIVGTALDNTHHVYSDLTPGSAWKHILSCKVRPGARRQWYLHNVRGRKPWPGSCALGKRHRYVPGLDDLRWRHSKS